MIWARPPRTRPPGFARFTALAAELRVLRGHAGRPLPDLVGEVERALGLDVEVAARPGATRPPRAPTWTRSRTRRPRSPMTRRSRRSARSSPT